MHAWLPARRLLPAMQFRGSLHAHILLWVDATDWDRVKQEITATRCCYRTEQQPDGTVKYKPDLPDNLDSAASRLLAIVDAKQIHVCRPWAGGCTYQRRDCKYAFPYAPNREGTVYDEATKRWVGRERLGRGLGGCVAAQGTPTSRRAHAWLWGLGG